jgi:hypothetical protein
MMRTMAGVLQRESSAGPGITACQTGGPGIGQAGGTGIGQVVFLAGGPVIGEACGSASGFHGVGPGVVRGPGNCPESSAGTRPFSENHQEERMWLKEESDHGRPWLSAAFVLALGLAFASAGFTSCGKKPASPPQATAPNPQPAASQAVAPNQPGTASTVAVTGQPAQPPQEIYPAGQLPLPTEGYPLRGGCGTPQTPPCRTKGVSVLSGSHAGGAGQAGAVSGPSGTEAGGVRQSQGEP